MLAALASRQKGTPASALYMEISIDFLIWYIICICILYMKSRYYHYYNHITMIYCNMLSTLTIHHYLLLVLYKLYIYINMYIHIYLICHYYKPQSVQSILPRHAWSNEVACQEDSWKPSDVGLFEWIQTYWDGSKPCNPGEPPKNGIYRH